MKKISLILFLLTLPLILVGLILFRSNLNLVKETHAQTAPVADIQPETVELIRYLKTGDNSVYDRWSTTSLQQTQPGAGYSKQNNQWITNGHQGYLLKNDDGTGLLTGLYDCTDNSDGKTNDHYNLFEPGCDKIANLPGSRPHTKQLIGYVYFGYHPEGDDLHHCFDITRNDNVLMTTSEIKQTTGRDECLAVGKDWGQSSWDGYALKAQSDRPIRPAGDVTQPGYFKINSAPLPECSNNKSGLKLSWTSSKFNTTLPNLQTKYRIFRTTNGSVAQTQVADGLSGSTTPGQTISYIDTNVVLGTTYNYHIVAYPGNLAVTATYYDSGWTGAIVATNNCLGATSTPSSSPSSSPSSTPSLSPSSSPSSSPTEQPGMPVLTKIEISEDPSYPTGAQTTVLNVPFSPDQITSMVYTPFTFQTDEPELKRIHIRYTATNGIKEESEALIELVKDSDGTTDYPKITNVSCMADGSNVTFKISGQFFGSNTPPFDTGIVKSGDTLMTIQNKSDGTSTWSQNPTESDPLIATLSNVTNFDSDIPVTVVRFDGEEDTSVCNPTAKSQLSIGAGYHCPAIPDKVTTGATMKIYPADEGTNPEVLSTKTVKITELGLIDWLLDPFEFSVGRKYIVSLDSKTALLAYGQDAFTAPSQTTGNTKISKVIFYDGDFNEDTIINSVDYGIMRTQWGLVEDTPKSADLNDDGIVNSFDYACLRFGLYPKTQSDQTFPNDKMTLGSTKTPSPTPFIEPTASPDATPGT